MSVKQLFSYFFHWSINVFLKLLKLKSRNQTIWLFGAWRGYQYSDNTKYLFEYVHKNCLDIEAIWITKEPRIKAQLIKKGYQCVLSNEKKARKLRLKAGVVFFTNGSHDFGSFDLCQGAIKVALWHGMPLKKIYFAGNYFSQNKKKLSRYIQYLMLKIYNKAERTLTIATSERSKTFMVESFEVNPAQVFITGQPRNDVLFDSKLVSETRNTLKHQENERFILYMPTWRDTGNYGDFFDNEAGFLDDIIKRLYADQEFMSHLKSNHIKLYIKPHPNRIPQFNSQGNVKILKGKEDPDSQTLMASADVLITDYSSVFIDFALIEKPIHFFVPDIQSYAKGNIGLFLKFEDFAKYWFKDLETFKNVITQPENYQEKGMANTTKINQIYDDSSLKKGEYSKNVVKLVRQQMKPKS